MIFAKKFRRSSVAAFVALVAVTVGSNSVAVANGTTCSFTVNGESAQNQEVNITIPPGLFEGLPDDLSFPEDLETLVIYLTPFASELDPAAITVAVTSTLADPYESARLVYGSDRTPILEESGSGLVPEGIDLPTFLLFLGVIQAVLEVEDDPIGFLRDSANRPYRIEYDILEGEGGPIKCSLGLILGEVNSGGFAFDGFRHYLDEKEESTLPEANSSLPATE